MSANEANKRTNDVYVSLGANIDPVTNLGMALIELSKNTNVLARSSFWRGPPIGIDEPDFINGAVHLQSAHSMHNFKRDVLRKIENDLGRQRNSNKFAARTIDLDILIFNEMEIEIDIWRYAYLAAPLAEIHPNYAHPKTGELLKDIARQLQAQSEMEKIISN